MGNHPIIRAVISLVLLLGGLMASQAAAPKVTVFILAGRSNMEGHGQVRSLDHLGDRPSCGHLLKRLQGPDGSGAARRDVTIYRNAKEKKHGPLTVGWGASEEETGPELMCGAIMGEHLKGPWSVMRCIGNASKPPAGPWC